MISQSNQNKLRVIWKRFNC